MQFLATTIPGLEAVACEEVTDLLGVPARRRRPGMIAFEAEPIAAFESNEHARSLHRVLIRIASGEIEEPQDAYEVTATIPVEEYLEPGQSIAVRGTRHGTHEFTSVDVAERVGQALVDGSREAFGDRVPVDLDEPDVTFRAYVREDRFVLTIDATGDRSLHRRHWRECEHNAPLRPTIAHAMVRLASVEPDDSLLDPMCGGGTLPIEAAGWALELPPGRTRESFDAGGLGCLPADGCQRVRTRYEERSAERGDRESVDVRGLDANQRWVRCARVNTRVAGLSDVVTIAQGDATEEPLDADVIAVDLPFGIRTPDDLPRLYDAFVEHLRAGDWDRFVAITTRPEFLDLAFDRRIDLRYGRLDASIVFVDR